MLTLGIDSGSTTTKAILFDGENIITKRLEPSGVRPVKVITSLYDELYSPEVGFVMSTGYGRSLLDKADKSMTEIACHGAGAGYLCPECNFVIDVGGQDSKVIALDENHNVKDFLMNDKCAAGTGRFVEMVMNRVGSSVDEIDDFVKGAEPVTINSMCAVFAESEIIGLLAQDTPSRDIALGCIYSICRRTAIFAQRLMPKDPVIFFSGGLAKSKTFQAVLTKFLGVKELHTSPLCQFNGALGAAVLGQKRLNKHHN